jgi:hypothetical protein
MVFDDSATRRRTFRCATVIALALYAVASGAAHAQERGFQFGLVGDLPYSKTEEQEFTRIIAMMNGLELAFVVHVGDMQNDPRPYNQNPARSSMPCTDAMNDWLLAQFQTIRHPVVMTPGDNDWTDCHHLKARVLRRRHFCDAPHRRQQR